MTLSQLAVNAAAAAEMTMGQKAISSAKVILTGFVVVFSMLLLIILVIKIYSTIVDKAQSSGDGKRKKLKEESVTEKIQRADVEESAESAAEDEIPEEVVAVIAAAVATLYLPSGVRPRIKSIKKAGARSAWASAGVAENTRPF